MKADQALQVLSDGSQRNRQVVWERDAPVLPTRPAAATLYDSGSLNPAVRLSRRAVGSVRFADPVSETAMGGGRTTHENAGTHKGVRERSALNVQQFRDNYGIGVPEEEHEERVERVNPQQAWIDAMADATHHLPRREADHRCLAIDVDTLSRQVEPLEPFQPRDEASLNCYQKRRAGFMEDRIAAPSFAAAAPDGVGFIGANLATIDEVRPLKNSVRMLESEEINPRTTATVSYATGHAHPDHLLLGGPTNADVMQHCFSDLRHGTRIAPEVEAWRESEWHGRSKRIKEIETRLAGKDRQMPTEDGHVNEVLLGRAKLELGTDLLVPAADRAPFAAAAANSAVPPVEWVGREKALARNEMLLEHAVEELGAHLRERNELLPTWDPLAF